MKKRASLLVMLCAIALTLCMAPTVAKAEGKGKNFVAATQAELLGALKSGGYKTITIRTDAREAFKLPKKYSNEKLSIVIDAPKATVKNMLTCQSIDIKDAAEVTECAKKNSIVVEDNDLVFTVAKSAKIASLEITSDGENVLIDKNGVINKLVTPDCKPIAMKSNGIRYSVFTKNGFVDKDLNEGWYFDKDSWMDRYVYSYGTSRDKHKTIIECADYYGNSLYTYSFLKDMSYSYYFYDTPGFDISSVTIGESNGDEKVRVIIYDFNGNEITNSEFTMKELGVTKLKGYKSLYINRRDEPYRVKIGEYFGKYVSLNLVKYEGETVPLGYLDMESGEFCKADSVKLPKKTYPTYSDRNVEFDSEKWNSCRTTNVDGVLIAGAADESAWCYLDKNQNLLASFADATNFTKNGYALVNNDGKTCYLIDSKLNVHKEVSFEGKNAKMTGEGNETTLLIQREDDSWMAVTMGRIPEDERKAIRYTVFDNEGFQNKELYDDWNFVGTDYFKSFFFNTGMAKDRSKIIVECCDYEGQVLFTNSFDNDRDYNVHFYDDNLGPVVLAVGTDRDNEELRLIFFDSKGRDKGSYICMDEIHLDEQEEYQAMFANRVEQPYMADVDELYGLNYELVWEFSKTGESVLFGYCDISSGQFRAPGSFKLPEKRYGYGKGYISGFDKARWFKCRETGVDGIYLANVADKSSWSYLDSELNEIAAFADATIFTGNGYALVSEDRKTYYIMDSEMKVHKGISFEGVSAYAQERGTLNSFSITREDGSVYAVIMDEPSDGLVFINEKAKYFVGK